jgi:hypothetical protein
LCNTKKVEDHQVESSTEQVHRTIYWTFPKWS